LTPGVGRRVYGPFAGLAYYDAAVPLVQRLVPKPLGIYERELHEPLRASLAEESVEIVVNGDWTAPPP
jgi:hypothetical protein